MENFPCSNPNLSITQAQNNLEEAKVLIDAEKKRCTMHKNMDKDDSPIPMSPYDVYFYLERKACAKRKSDSHPDNASTAEDDSNDDMSAKRRKLDAEVRLVLMKYAQDNAERRINMLKEAQERQANKIASFNSEDVKTPTLKTPFGELAPANIAVASRPYFSGEEWRRNESPNAEIAQSLSSNRAFQVNESISQGGCMGEAQPSLLRHSNPFRPSNMFMEAQKMQLNKITSFNSEDVKTPTQKTAVASRPYLSGEEYRRNESPNAQNTQSLSSNEAFTVNKTFSQDGCMGEAQPGLLRHSNPFRTSNMFMEAQKMQLNKITSFNSEDVKTPTQKTAVASRPYLSGEEYRRNESPNAQNTQSLSSNEAFTVNKTFSQGGCMGEAQRSLLRHSNPFHRNTSSSSKVVDNGAKVGHLRKMVRMLTLSERPMIKKRSNVQNGV